MIAWVAQIANFIQISQSIVNCVGFRTELTVAPIHSRTLRLEFTAKMARLHYFWNWIRCKCKLYRRHATVIPPQTHSANSIVIRLLIQFTCAQRSHIVAFACWRVLTADNKKPQQFAHTARSKVGGECDISVLYLVSAGWRPRISLHPRSECSQHTLCTHISHSNKRTELQFLVLFATIGNGSTSAYDRVSCKIWTMWSRWLSSAIRELCKKIEIHEYQS